MARAKRHIADVALRAGNDFTRETDRALMSDYAQELEAEVEKLEAEAEAIEGIIVAWSKD